MTKPQAIQSDQWLADIANECRRNIAAIAMIDWRKVTIDIAARTAEVAWIKRYICRRTRLIKELEKRGQSEEEWRAGLGPGHSISQVRRAIQLARPGAFPRYVRRRRALGDNGRFGLAYAIELAQREADESDESATSPHPEMRDDELAARVADKADGRSNQPARPLRRYWLTPPDEYARLDAIYHSGFDPFPTPRPPNFDGLAVPWKRINSVNPPFSREDELHGRRLSDIIRKAIAERMLGNSSLILVPVNSITDQLLAAGAIGTSLGRPNWLDVESGEPGGGSGCIAAFLLKGRDLAVA